MRAARRNRYNVSNHPGLNPRDILLTRRSHGGWYRLFRRHLEKRLLLESGILFPFFQESFVALNEPVET